MKNRHAIIDPQTGLVRNVVIWEGAAWLPPKDHYVVHDCDGQIGDYWHQDSNAFYTISGKRRFCDEQGKVGEKELTAAEQKALGTRLKEVYEHAFKKYNWRYGADVTRADAQVPAMLQRIVDELKSQQEADASRSS